MHFKAENYYVFGFFILLNKIALKYIIRIILFYTFTQNKHILTK